ncbi:Glycosyl transferase [Chitinispirillum alkaliphilum]|nr:Glycosyl transferase [Chitinispirillum alkaliphilum]
MKNVEKIAIIGDFSTCRQPISIYTNKLYKSISQISRNNTPMAATLCEGWSKTQSFPANVRFKIDREKVSSFRLAAEFFNLTKTEIVSLQYPHSFLSGSFANHIIELLSALNSTVITTLHSVIEHPDENQKRLTGQIASLSARIVVGSRSAGICLRELYNVDEKKIEIIPTPQHSAPESGFWDKTASHYIELFHRARETASVKAVSFIKPAEFEFPEFRFDHIVRMSDSTGVFQHAKCTIPNFYEGYCTDDNARALILSVQLEELGKNDPAISSVGITCLAFLNYALNRQTARFRNFMDFGRRWLEEIGSEDSHGRALWALGTCVGRSKDPAITYVARELFDIALQTVRKLRSPRAWAFSLLGICEYLKGFDGDLKVTELQRDLTKKLISAFKTCADENWLWFEDICTYSNARLPHALIMSARRREDRELLTVGLETLRWIVEVQTNKEGVFTPVGCNGWYTRNGNFASHDQQPVEACGVVSACLEAFRVTKEPWWFSKAQMGFEWFLGRNSLGVPVYNKNSGGCRDAIHEKRLNLNEGAESTLAFLLSLCEMYRYKGELKSWGQVAQSL